MPSLLRVVPRGHCPTCFGWSLDRKFSVSLSGPKTIDLLVLRGKVETLTVRRGKVEGRTRGQEGISLPTNWELHKKQGKKDSHTS